MPEEVFFCRQFNGLIAALGGALGLFTGIAIIMLFEILELAWDVGFNIWDALYET
jgi:hypothetical protein